MLTRRDVLRATLRGSSLLALAPNVPGFLARTARAAAPEADGRVLVVVQLDGGNDGLNTLIPYRDDIYARLRPSLRIPIDEVVKVNDTLGLHPRMTAASELLETGRLAIVPGVGYPNPDRSHFASMAIWHTGRTNPADHDGNGWLGRAFDEVAASTSDVTPSIFVGTDPPPVALRGRRARAEAIERIEDCALDPMFAPLRGLVDTGAESDSIAAFAQRTTLDSYAAADRVTDLINSAEDGARYPGTVLGGRMATIARLLKSGLGARVLYTMQPGYDTHAAQAATHGALLGELSGALKAFLDDLDTAGLADRVVVLCFSEFGRRVAENGSAGTDHGAAGPIFLAGPNVAPGIHGTYPSLENLDDGDLRTIVDFRRVYATILRDWLGLPGSGNSFTAFETMDLLRS